MRTRMLSATARSKVSPFYVADGRTSRERRRGHRRHHRISRHTLIARQSIREDMAPMIRAAKKAGVDIYLPCQDRWFNPVDLQKEMARGRFCMGPRWFRVDQVAA